LPDATYSIELLMDLLRQVPCGFWTSRVLKKPEIVQQVGRFELRSNLMAKIGPSLEVFRGAMRCPVSLFVWFLDVIVSCELIGKGLTSRC
jgi:hypothetical protein